MKTTITKTEEVEVTIPYFGRYYDSLFYAILDENIGLSVCLDSGISNRNPKAILADNLTVITKEEFMEAFNKEYERFIPFITKMKSKIDQL
jgi:hypothetical protein